MAIGRFYAGRYYGGRYYGGRFFGGGTASTQSGAVTLATPTLAGVGVVETFGAVTLATPTIAGLGTRTNPPVTPDTTRALLPLFGWPMYGDASVTYTPAYSGGSWRTALPLTNLADRRLARVARSSDATLAATTFQVDLGVARTIGVLALPKHNFSTAAQVRWRASSVAGVFTTPIYDSGWEDAWPSGVTTEDTDGINVAAVHIPATVQTARYWRCDIDDTANTAGYVDLSRAVIAGAWYPSQGGMSLGARLGLETATVRTVTDGGAAFYLQKPMRRTWDFAVQNLAETEALASAWRLQRQVGQHGQLFFVFDINDPSMYERSFLCVLREVSPLEFSYAAYHTATFRLLEEL